LRDHGKRGFLGESFIEAQKHCHQNCASELPVHCGVLSDAEPPEDSPKSS